MNISMLTGGGIGSRRRRFFGMNRVQPRPYDAEVEYIEVNASSNGYPCIFTDFIPSGTDNELYMDVMINGYENGVTWTAWFSALTKSEDNEEFFRIIRNNNLNNDAQVNWSSKENSATNFVYEPNSKLNIHIKNKQLNINGKNYTLTQNALGANIRPLSIFGYASQGCRTYMRLYYFKWIEGEKIIFDLIPVRVGDEGYMYDKVSGKLFGNSGTGKFILGPDMA